MGLTLNIELIEKEHEEREKKMNVEKGAQGQEQPPEWSYIFKGSYTYVIKTPHWAIKYDDKNSD